MAEDGRGGDPPPQSGEAAEWRGVNVVCLPDEVMLNVFSSLSFNDLVDNVQNVCRRWKRLAHDPTLWLDKEYVVWGRGSLLKGHSCCGVDWSKCIHCRYEGKDEDILWTAAVTPQLRKLTLLRNVKVNVFKRIVENWPNLTTLKIDTRQSSDREMLEHIFEKCPKIQRLTLDSCQLMGQMTCEVLSALEDLRSLEVTVGWTYTRKRVDMRQVAAACPRLREINFRWHEHDVDEVGDFLAAKRDCITAASLSWVVAETQCVVPLLRQCRRLRKLELDHFHVTDSMVAAGFKALGELHTLEELSLKVACLKDPKVASLAFRPGRLTQLRRLVLRSSGHLQLRNDDCRQDETLEAICRGCLNLRELRLYGMHCITDAGLAEIHRLQHLQKLVLSDCWVLHEAMSYIAQLPALHTLVLEKLDLYEMLPRIRDILEMKELRRLDILQCSGIELVPFDEFPNRLAKLRELRVVCKELYTDEDWYTDEDTFIDGVLYVGMRPPHEDQEKVFCKKVFAELRSRMPHLSIFDTFWLEDGDNPGDEERDYYTDGDSCDGGDDNEYSEGGYAAGFYIGFNA